MPPVPDEGTLPVDLVALMELALGQAQQAAALGEVPVGAVVALGGVVVGVGHNRTLLDRDPSAHAEIVALREAARTAGNHRLMDAVLVTTLEPCLMCCGAAVQARVARLVHAADDPKAGALDTLRKLMDTGRLNHRIALEHGHGIALARGPAGEESARLLRDFFQVRR